MLPNSTATDAFGWTPLRLILAVVSRQIEPRGLDALEELQQ